MKIIIDGYNLLRSPFVNKLTVDKLMHYLSLYSNQKGHTILLVFDGGNSSWPYKLYKDSLTIIYSGSKSNADTVIKGLISEVCRGKECLIVSSDREIALYAQKNTIISIEVDIFYKILKQRLSPAKAEKKGNLLAIKRTGYQSSPELDALMEKSKAIRKEEDEEELFREGSLSKRDRRIREIIKKL